ncbi:MAG: YncE family protein [Pyrinomonadaceae bacterium]|nr:YncE family protein [Blastocatellia bacterium]MCW5957199.1 YncE family protein [Pyrinomonadaceae bacterium]
MKIRNKFVTLIALGVVIFFKNYVIVIGQTKPVLVALNKTDATLAIINPATMKVTAKVPTGDSPHEVVLSADGKTAFVANYGAQTPGNSLSVIDLATAKELRRVDLSPLFRPHGIQMIGGKLYFTAETNRMIARYDPAANKVDWLMGSGQNATHMIAVSADEKKFYTTNIGSDSVTAFEFQNVPPAASKITHIPVGKQPEAIDISPDGKEVWAGLNVDGMIEVVDTAALKSKEKINIGGRPYRVKFTPDGKAVVCTMPASKELLIIDSVSRKELKRIKLESAPLGIVFSANGKTAFVSAGQPDVVLKIDLDTGEVTGRVETGKVPDGIAVAGI